MRHTARHEPGLEQGTRGAHEGSPTRNPAARNGARVTSGDHPPEGDINRNPEDISFLALLFEDFRTHDRDLFEPGFWAVAIHRFGNWRMGVRHRPLRAPLTAVYRMMFTTIEWFWGIDLCYTVKLGRRVRLWHHGCMILGAQAIGNDVHIRHGTTFGLLHRTDAESGTPKKPIIEDRCDIGTGVCILGDVTIGHDSVVGANSVVLRSFPPHSVLFGVPARPVDIKRPKGPSGPCEP